MDHAVLLLGWGCMDIPFTVVDSEAGTLPSGFMHMRVKMTLGRKHHTHTHLEDWPKVRPHRQKSSLQCTIFRHSCISFES
jgi:hypothetical protein